MTLPYGDYCEFNIYTPENMGMGAYAQGDVDSEYPSDKVGESISIKVDNLTFINYTVDKFALFISVRVAKDHVLNGVEQLIIHYNLHDRPLFSGPAAFFYYNNQNKVKWLVSVYLNLHPVNID